MLPWESEIFGYLGNVVKEEDLSTEDHHTLLAIMYRLLSRYQNHGGCANYKCASDFTDHPTSERIFAWHDQPASPNSLLVEM